MLEAQACGPRELVLLAKRNCSIAPLPMCAIFAALGSLALSIGAAWALFGAWLILPFAGLEAVALVVALVAHARRAGDFERIHLREGRGVVEIFEMDRVRRHEFNPSWARLVRLPSGSRLAVRYAGTEFEVGRFLNEDGRRRLYDELRRWLSMAGAT